MGTVYRAHDSKLNRTVAIKFLSDEFADAAARRRFQREAQTASSLNHPHIVTVYDAGEFEGRQYLVTEFIDGGTLKDWAATPRTPREIADLLTGVADGLAAAHDSGILHRDIKPHNILVTKSGYAKLADFGLARAETPTDNTRTLSEARTRPGFVIGTIAYMSPEQASGKPLDSRSDIFSFGIVLYELLAGQKPFSASNDLELLQRIAHADPPPLDSKIPARFRAIVNKALEKDPARRYQSMRELVADLKNPTESIAAIPTRPSWIWQAGALAVIILAAAAWFLTRSKPSGPAFRSIAVLPLQNLSGDPAQEYFSDGTTEALISSLAQLHDLKVISCTSVMRYKATTKSLPDIGRELGVDAILEGSIQRANGRVRITAQLIAASTDAHLWAKEYDRDLADVLKLEADVAREIAREIQLQLTPQETQRFTTTRRIDPQAQDAYLRARYHSWKLDESDLARSIELYQEAIRIQPDYAAAYAGLARSWVERSVWGNLPFRAGEVPIRDAIRKALELDPNLGEAHAILGHVFHTYDWNWTESEREFRRALELDPNNLTTHDYLGSLYMALGRFDDSVAQLESAARIDPASSTIQSTYGRVLYRAKRYPEAEPHLRRAIELDNQNFSAYTRLADMYEATGRLQDALEIAKKGLEIRGADFVKSDYVGRIYAELGKREEALKILPHVLSAPRVNRLSIARFYFALGDMDRGFQFLRQAFDEREFVTYTKYDPAFFKVKSDPRFVEIVARLHIPDRPE